MENYIGYIGRHKVTSKCPFCGEPGKPDRKEFVYECYLRYKLYRIDNQKNRRTINYMSMNEVELSLFEITVIETCWNVWTGMPEYILRDWGDHYWPDGITKNVGDSELTTIAADDTMGVVQPFPFGVRKCKLMNSLKT